MKPSSPLDKNVMVWSASAKIKASEEGCAMMYTSPGRMTAAESNVFQYSYSPTTLGALLTLGNA